MMDGLKKPGKTLAILDGARDKLHLVELPDGRFAIRQEQRIIGVWGPDEQQDCFQAFVDLAFKSLGAPLVVVLRKGTATGASAQSPSVRGELLN